jgi:diguanylate cyclase (GGDEF)-like protein
MDRLEHALQSRRRAQTGVLFVDIDGFKAVNDRLGHDVGDQVLTIVAERLAGVVRPGDTVSRLSGDEFVLILEDSADGNAPEVVAMRLLKAVKRPIEVRGHVLTLALSIGTAKAESATDTAEDLLRNADFAMYVAKQAGGARYRRYEAQARTAVDDNVRLEAVTALARWPTDGRILRSSRRRVIAAMAVLDNGPDRPADYPRWWRDRRGPQEGNIRMNRTQAVHVIEALIAAGPITAALARAITPAQLDALASLLEDDIAPTYVCADLDLPSGSMWGEVSAEIQRRGQIPEVIRAAD